VRDRGHFGLVLVDELLAVLVGAGPVVSDVHWRPVGSSRTGRRDW
jgi:hypothetical protein